MTNNPDIAAAIRHLQAFLGEGQWRARLGAHRDEVLAPILDAARIDGPELLAILHQHDQFAAFATCIDEALYSARLEPDDANAIDAYLKRRGWQETPRAREYLQGLRDATPSVWEVRATEPGDWVEVRDRLGDGAVVRVAERSGSTQLQRYDRMVARVVPVRDVHMFTGGLLMLTHEVADELERALRRLAKSGQSTRESVAAACIQIWTVCLLHDLNRPLPELQTTHGESLLIGRTRLACAPGVTATEVHQRLDKATRHGWERMDEEDGEPVGWLWFGTGKARSGAAEPSTILATCTVESSDALIVEAMSKARMVRALKSLAGVLGALVTAGLTNYEDPMQQLARRRADGPAVNSPAGARKRVSNVEVDATDAGEMLRQVTDAHYRRTLDDKVPMLGSRTPRECARTKAGRKKLVAWLKYLENAELHRAAAAGHAPYDFGWLWRELGVESER